MTVPLRGIKSSPSYLTEWRRLTLADIVEFFNLVLADVHGCTALTVVAHEGYGESRAHCLTRATKSTAKEATLGSLSGAAKKSRLVEDLF